MFYEFWQKWTSNLQEVVKLPKLAACAKLHSHWSLNHTAHAGTDLPTTAFIIEHKPNKDDDYPAIRHLYFKTVTLNNNNYKLMFVVSLTNIEQPKLLSFYKADLYERITVGDTILYEGGQQTKVILSKG